MIKNFESFVIFSVIFVFMGLVIIKIQDFKNIQLARKKHLHLLLDKFENLFNNILYHIDEIERYLPADSWQVDLEIRSMRSLIAHQMGHLPRFRCLLK
jgi:hypothetical protein